MKSCFIFPNLVLAIFQFSLMLILPLQSVYSVCLVFPHGFETTSGLCMYLHFQTMLRWQNLQNHTTQHNTWHTEVIWKVHGSVCWGNNEFRKGFFFSPILLCFSSSHLNFHVCEATHKWPQTLASLRECSSKIKIFLYLPKTEFQSVNWLIFSV